MRKPCEPCWRCGKFAEVNDGDSCLGPPVCCACYSSTEPAFKECPLNGLNCSVCGLEQRVTWSGVTCPNGHGGADGVPMPVDFPTVNGDGWELIQGDCLDVLKTFADACVQTCVTSPPYWGLRDYGVEGQIGNEATPEEYVTRLAEVFREVRRVLRPDGTLWLNLGDSYAGNGSGFRPGSGRADGRVDERGQRNRNGNPCPPGLKPKDLVGIPWMVAFVLRADGWYLRSDIVWHKPNPMPESVTDRPTKAHEYIFLLTKSERYYYDAEAIKEPAVTCDPRKPHGRGQASVGGRSASGGREGTREENANSSTRNRRSVWTVATEPFKGAHFATFPPDLIEPCILAGAPLESVVLDPFNGAGTTGLVALKHGRRYVGIELNPEYVTMTEERLWSAHE